MTRTENAEAPPVEPGLLDLRALRGCLSQFATGVTVVSYRAEGEIRGATVNSFTSVSMDPPLIMVSLAHTSRAAAWLGRTPFVVNVLAATQLDIAMQFAGRPRHDLEVAWVERSGVPPRLRAGVAWLECRPWAVYPGGDHLLFLGEVVRYDAHVREPLLFHRGEFRMTGPALRDLPHDTGLDGVPTTRWLGHAHRLQHLTEPRHLVSEQP